ncbi:7254_t:CDS:2 [Dentiscutata heterogama]|uniref:7254_t:CDS:1 n=1 Tax=Dentiscutata heterogama TaxID=1316150 RepID=A0ACA9LSY6_9GLOM|nr:7254_t:CDS:2 [Dentiscutata heterogama]
MLPNERISQSDNNNEILLPSNNKTALSSNKDDNIQHNDITMFDNNLQSNNITEGLITSTTKNERGSPLDQTYRRCTYACDRQGTYEPKKSVILENQRNSKSKRTRCPWHINVTFPKKATTISITSLNISHNHLLDFQTNLYASKNQTLPEAFPNIMIYLRDLQNLIQKYKIANQEENDASKLLKHLLNKKAKELGWEVASYLNSELYSSKKKWAKAYTNKFFTAGISSTSHVNSENVIIKNVLQGHPSLCELAAILDLQGASAKCFPEIDHILKKYLTEEMLS